jgi:hypothetical protein
VDITLPPIRIPGTLYKIHAIPLIRLVMIRIINQPKVYFIQKIKAGTRDKKKLFFMSLLQLSP